MPSLIMGEKLEVSRDMDTYTRRVPLGVGAAICPYVRSVRSIAILLTLDLSHRFNFPAMIPLWSIPMAIATGNSLILKPSERDPGAAMIIAELCDKAGMSSISLLIKHRTNFPFKNSNRSTQRSYLSPPRWS
jgi:malonate-semialdehyde dehydrogenase (acetylating)/methylmalonate-semialdehyde dehydrogenase